MGRGKHDLRRAPGFKRLFPTGDAQTPMIAVLETAKSELRNRSGEIVAHGLAKSEKIAGQHYADEVETVVIGTGVAATVAIETRHWIGATEFEVVSKNVHCEGHDHVWSVPDGAAFKTPPFWRQGLQEKQSISRSLGLTASDVAPREYGECEEWRLQRKLIRTASGVVKALMAA